jgi:hypothetical protein
MNTNIPNNKINYSIMNQKLLEDISVKQEIENPYEHFGIYDSEGEIDFVRIKRIRKTQYYKYYRSFRDHFKHYGNFRDYHKLNKKEKADKIEYFFNNYDYNTMIEDYDFVDQEIDI